MQNFLTKCLWLCLGIAALAGAAATSGCRSYDPNLRNPYPPDSIVSNPFKPLPPPPNWSYQQYTADKDGFYRAWQQYLTAALPQINYVNKERGFSDIELTEIKLYDFTTDFGSAYKHPFIPLYTIDEFLSNMDPGAFAEPVPVTSSVRFNNINGTIYLASFVNSRGDRFDIIDRDMLRTRSGITIFESGPLDNFYGLSLGLVTGPTNIFGINLGVLGSANPEVFGLQVGVLMNSAVNANGLQVGLVNTAFVSDSMALQIGLMNFNGRIWFPLLNLVY